MAVYLHDRYAKQIAEVFSSESLVQGRLSGTYSFAGVKTVKVSTPITVPMTDYTRTGANRYGAPKEMQDVVQEMSMSQDKSFALTIDKGNNADQNGIKSAARMLKLQLREQAIPAMDRYVFGRLVHKAGKIAGNGTALTKANVLERIQTATQYMDDKEVPQEGRTLFVPSGTFALIKQSGVDLKTENVSEKAFVKGQVGDIDGMKIVKVPAGRWVTHCNFLVVYKNSAIAPTKLNDTKHHQDPPGISGDLLEGRQYYDCFVLAAKCDGVYADIDTGSGKGTVLEAPTIGDDGSITPTSGATAYYTTDGSDPRYSMSAKTGTSVQAHSGEKIRAYQTKEGSFDSPVAEVEAA